MGDYDYANARLRAMKSRLFDAHTYAEWSSLARLDDLIARLLESTYAEEVKAGLARYVGVRVVMEACRLHLAHTFCTLRDFFEGEGARLVGILLARYDLHNLKTILRGQAAGVPAEELLEALVPVSRRALGATGAERGDLRSVELDESALRTLVREPDIAATVDLLRTWNIRYARAIRRAFDEYVVTRDWLAFEAALDAILYAQWLAALRRDAENDKMVRQLLAREIDVLNVMTALRLRSTISTATTDAAEAPAADVTRFLIQGGNLAPEQLIELARVAPENETLARLRALPFNDALARIETLDLVQIQCALDRDLAHFGASFFARDPLTIATAIGFITAKNVEVKNIRLLAQGLALDWERAEIEKELIIV
ncbi:MAG: V-type ATPase subunit [Chloroflexi bacterium]|nr:V-type ATPase subunit [Chloroflexota bacterium]